MRTPKQEQHAYWLDHYDLYGMVAGFKPATEILNTPRIAAPTPTNGTQPIPEHCLIWPGPVNDDGYGYGYGKWHGGESLAHRAAYAASRQGSIPSDAMVLHLCHRPYCWQPSHLYLGDASMNSEDRVAYHSSGMGMYKTWSALGKRTRAGLYDGIQYHLDTPGDPLPLVPSLPGMAPPPKVCPHTFDVPAGDARLCSGCGISTFAGEREARLQEALAGLRWIEQNGLGGREAEQQRRHICDIEKSINRDRCHETGIPNPCRSRGL